jgi:hypothetical protein
MSKEQDIIARQAARLDAIARRSLKVLVPPPRREDLWLKNAEAIEIIDDAIRAMANLGLPRHDVIRLLRNATIELKEAMTWG